MKKISRLLTLILCVLLMPGVFSINAAAANNSMDALPFSVDYFFSSSEYDESTHTINFFVPDELTEIELTLLFDKGFDGTAYADCTLTQPIKISENGKFTVRLAQMFTYLYIKCNEQADITYRLNVISKRAPIEYRDDHSIADWARVYVDFCNELGHGIIQGDPNKNANPHQFLTRYEIALISARMAGADTTLFSDTKLPYKDSIAPWAKSGVNAMTVLGVINGHKNQNDYYYCGSDNVTREQVAKIMVDLLLLKEATNKSADTLYQENKKAYDNALSLFADAEKISEWAVPYMALAVGRFGFVTGSKDNGALYLNPQKNITRQEMTVIVAKESGYDIDVLLEHLILKVGDELSTTSKPTSSLKSLKDALSKAQAARYNSSSKDKKESAYVDLHKELKKAFHSYVVYLSPSNQMSNSYTGVNTNEGAQMQAVADLLKPMLENMGFVVHIADPASNIRVRGEDALKKNADIYVAIHSNATGGTNNGRYQGSLIFHSNNHGSKELAESVSKYLSKVTPTVDNGIENDSLANNPFIEIRDPVMANILVEVEFHDYATYAKWIVNNKNKLAEAFADGIREYFYGK